MTVLEEKTTEAPEALETQPSSRSREKAQRRPSTALAGTGTALGLLGLFLLGFLAYLYAFSGVQEARSQTTLYRTLRDQMNRAVVPVGPAADGTPIAALDIARLGLHKAVVLEGTRPADLTRGPGHRVDTPLPGQAGVSVIGGRRATFGAPFSKLSALREGDLVIVTTGYGRARYRVNAFGDDQHPITDPASNRLVLITADSSTIPRHSIMVGARLVGRAMPDAGNYPLQPPDNEKNLAIDLQVLQPLMLWSLALVIAAALGTVASHRWARWPAYLCSLPIVLAITWNVYENAAQLVPNLY